MANIKLINDCGIPQFSCSSCCNCSSTSGISLISNESRGCCWYFPKFTLCEIHQMVKSEEGLKVLQQILEISEVKIHNYYIHAKGFFNEEAHKKFLENGENEEEKYKKHDSTIFFRTCPFVKPGEGCLIPAKYRSYVCNFFICDEIVKELKKTDEYYKYEKEMNSYARWVSWENKSLQMLLEEKNINLINNFEEVINVLKEVPLTNYEFADLNEIQF